MNAARLDLFRRVPHRGQSSRCVVKRSALARASQRQSRRADFRKLLCDPGLYDYFYCWLDSLVYPPIRHIAFPWRGESELSSRKWSASRIIPMAS
jgi:hypothetical protein